MCIIIIIIIIITLFSEGDIYVYTYNNNIIIHIHMYYYICCHSCLTLNILTTVKSYDELLRKLKIDHYVCKIGLLKIK